MIMAALVALWEIVEFVWLLITGVWWLVSLPFVGLAKWRASRRLERLQRELQGER